MKKTILILIAVFSISILNAQRYINIGSSKSDVKKVMGEPTSIRNYEFSKKEVWGYGEYGFATVTFKNGKLFEYSNMDGILKIGKLTKELDTIGSPFYTNKAKDTIINSTLPPMRGLVKWRGPKKKSAFSGISEELINKLKGNAGSSYRGIRPGFYHPQEEELARLNMGITNLTEEDMNKDFTSTLAASQPFAEKLSNMFKAGFYTTLAGLVQAFDYDIPDMVGMLQGKEREYGSWLSRIAESLQDKAAEYPIYQEGRSYSDPAYWMNMYVTLGYYVGMAL